MTRVKIEHFAVWRIEFDIYNPSWDIADPFLLKDSTEIGQKMSSKTSERGTKSFKRSSPCSFGGYLSGTKSCRGLLGKARSCSLWNPAGACARCRPLMDERSKLCMQHCYLAALRVSPLLRLSHLNVVSHRSHRCNRQSCS